MKEAIIAFLIALAIGAAINSYSGSTVTPPPTEIGQHATGESSGVLEAAGSKTPETSDNNFDGDVLTGNVPVMVDFYSNACQPCMKMAPIYSQLAADNTGKAKFFRLDVEQNPSVAARFNVNAIPTFIIFKGGQRVESFTGLVSKDILEMAVNKAL